MSFITSLFKEVFGPKRRQALERRPDAFLRDVSGVIHVGANAGQERHYYQAHGLRVVWIEPIPEIFAQLMANLKSFRGQLGLQALVTDIDGKEYRFHIANNNGASSSILDFKHHVDIWPDVAYTTAITLTSTTLTSLLDRERIDLHDYQALVMDTQGSELLVLRGSIPILRNFEYIKTEVPDFEAYEGCCQLADIAAFMREHGYEEYSRHRFASRPAGGSYFDIVYRRKP